MGDLASTHFLAGPDWLIKLGLGPIVAGFLVATVVNLGLAGAGIFLLRVRRPGGVARQEAA